MEKNKIRISISTEIKNAEKYIKKIGRLQLTLIKTKICCRNSEISTIDCRYRNGNITKRVKV